MANARLPQLAIKANQLKQQDVEFTPFNLQLEPINFDALERGFAKDEERKQKALDKVSEVKTILGKSYNALHQSEDNMNFIRNLKTDVDKAINERIQLGDYDGAMTVARRLGDDIANNEELNARIIASENWNNNVVKSVTENNTLSQATKRWWLAKNPFKFKERIDDNGNKIYDTTFEQELANRPVEDINWSTIMKIGADLVEAKSTSTSNTLNKSNTSGYHKDGSGSTKTTTRDSSSTKSVTIKTKDQILKSAEEYIYNNQQVLAQARQAWQVYLYGLESGEFGDSEKLQTRNGSPVDLDTFIKTHLLNSYHAESLTVYNTSNTHSQTIGDSNQTTEVTKTPTNPQGNGNGPSQFGQGQFGTQGSGGGYNGRSILGAAVNWFGKTFGSGSGSFNTATTNSRFGN